MAMKSKLKLSAKPKFKRVVSVPMPGNEAAVEVEFEFVGRGVRAYQQFLNDMADGAFKDDAELMQAFVCGWNLEDEFTDGNIGLLVDSYIGIVSLLLDVYSAELWKARAGN